MKTRVVILTFIVWTGVLSAQTFNVANNYNTNGIFYESVAMSNSAIYANGYGSEISSPLNPKLYISKYTKKGDFIFNKGYTEPGLALFSSPHGLILKNDSVFNFGEVQGNGFFNRIFCVVTDTLGNKIYFKEYLDTTSENEVLYHSQISQNKKGFLLVGSIQNSISLDINVGVFFLNNKLEMTAKYEFGNSNRREIAYSATELSNGNIVVGAHRYDANKVNGTRYKEQTWIFEIDTAGNMVRQFLDSDTRTGPAKGITQTPDGGFVYCGRKQSFWNGNATYYYGGTIAKLKPDYSGKEWEKKVTDSVGNLISMESIQKLNNNFIGIGNNSTDFENDWEKLLMGYIIKFNEKGKVFFQRHFTSIDTADFKGWNYLYEATVSANGDIIACGKTEPQNGPNLGWILKLDSTGCLTPSNCGYPSLSAQEITPTQKELTVYPNPFTTFLNIEGDEEIKKVEIYDVFGKLVHKENTIKNTLQLGNLPKGLYILEAKTENGERFLEKVLKY